MQSKGNCSMSDNVIQFPMGGDRESMRLRMLIDQVGLNEAARMLGTPEDWAFTSLAYLKTEMGARIDGEITVWIPALLCIVEYFEEMAERLGIIGGGGDAA